jgi:asparagine synthase (glutamine-hydrolysing)
MSITPATLHAMCAQIEHRGPDAYGTFIYKGIGLAAQRLSVIDPQAGAQPILNEMHTKAIVLNGAIYNYRALRHSLESLGHVFSTSTDTEVVLHAYEQYGEQCLSHLRGMFAFAIADGDTESMFIGRDHFGVKPLYYHLTPERLVFASEIKALLVDRTVPRLVDQHALLDYACQGFVTAPRTLFRDVFKLPPSCYLRLRHNSVKLERYWKITSSPHPRETSLHTCAAKIADLTQKAVLAQVQADVPVGLFFSGGVDSSSLLVAMTEGSNRGVKTFTVGFEGPGQSEVSRAEYVANSLNAQHISRRLDANASAALLPSLVWHLDEPLADSSYVATFLAAQLASESVKVVLSGTGGDELFGGYRRYLAWPLIVALRRLPPSLRRLLTLTVPAQIGSRRDLRHGSAAAMAGRVLRRFSIKTEHLEVYREFLRLLDNDVLTSAVRGDKESPESVGAGSPPEVYASGLRGLQEYDIRHSLTDSLLLLTDKMCMACHLEARVPLLDVDLAEYALGLPSRFKVGFRRLRSAQCEALSQVLPRGATRLPYEKHGFGWPVSALIRGGLKDFVQDWLSESRLRREGFFEPRAVNAMIHDHCTGAADFGDELLALVTFEIWHSVFIQGPSVVPHVATL